VKRRHSGVVAGDAGENGGDEEDMEAKRRRILAESREMDADEDSEEDEEDSSDDDDSDEDEDAELQRELERVRREREEKKRKEVSKAKPLPPERVATTCMHGLAPPHTQMVHTRQKGVNG
jgi:hypothetical protein